MTIANYFGLLSNKLRGNPMPSIRLNDGAMIEYYDSGAVDNRPVLVFMHGWGVSGQVFKQQIALKDEFRIIILDLRGCGKSTTGNDLSISKIGFDLFEIIDDLALENVHVIAWSMAAMAAWKAIANKSHNEIKSITIIDMSPKISNDENWDLGILGHHSLQNDEGRNRLEKSIASMKINWIDFSERMVGRIFSKSKIQKNDNKTIQFKNEISQIANKNDGAFMSILWNSLANCDARDDLAKITIPCLLIYGLDNQLYSSKLGQKVQSLIKNSSLVEFAHCGHAPHIEDSEHFNQTIREFINQIESDENNFFYDKSKKGNGSFFTQDLVGQTPQ